MKKNLLIIILAALLAACVGIGSFYIFKSLDGKTPKPSKELLKCDTIPADTSGANVPNLPTNMIPVCYNSEKDVWVKADSSNSSSDNRWYSYNNKIWANAVTVTSANREAYLNAQVGTQIPMEEINTMFVWIPRFKATGDTKTYNGTNDINNSGAFNITFVSNTTKAHDAFTFGTQELNGFWMGKFELSHTTLASTEKDNTLGCTTSTCSNANGIIIKPNVKSLRNNNVSNFFYGILSMKQSGNAFGFDSNVDTHMIKNSEWGAVAYLTQSIYGKCSNSISCTDVYLNNSEGQFTGRSGGNVAGSTRINEIYKEQTSVVPYNTYGYYTYDGYLLEYNTNKKTKTKDISKVASTTGNIYGVYDMSGGSFEYVMGVYTDGTRQWSGRDSTDNSGFTGCLGKNCSSTYSGVVYPDSKYYYSYTNRGNWISPVTNYNNSMQHALTETYGWYNVFGSFVSGDDLWFLRGGFYDALFSAGYYAGVFHYRAFSGGSFDSFSSRVVLAK